MIDIRNYEFIIDACCLPVNQIVVFRFMTCKSFKTRKIQSTWLVKIYQNSCIIQFGFSITSNNIMRVF